MEGESGIRHWDELIPDVLGLIFKKLSFEEVLEVIPVVCKSWCKAVEGPYCWQRIDINEWSWTIQYNPVKVARILRTLIMRSSGSLRELCISCVDDQMFSFIAEHAGSLQTLIVSSSSISDSIVEQVATKFSSLTTLDISGCDKITARGLDSIGRNCQMLVSLTWNPNQALEEGALVISRTMPKLKYLRIASSSSCLSINTPDVLNILSGCPELETLDLRGCWSVMLDGKILEENYPKVEVVRPVVGALFETSMDSESDYSDGSGDYSGDESIECYDGYYYY